MRKGKASSATGSASAKRSLIMLYASAWGERNHAFCSGNTGLPNSRCSSASHGPASTATPSAAAERYAKPARQREIPGMASASGSAANAKIAFEYLSAAAAPNSAPASAA